jgi:hypothetical protein
MMGVAGISQKLYWTEDETIDLGEGNTIQASFLNSPATTVSLLGRDIFLINSNMIPNLTFMMNFLSSLILLSLLMALPFLIGRLIGNMQGLV